MRTPSRPRRAAALALGSLALLASCSSSSGSGTASGTGANGNAAGSSTTADGGSTGTSSRPAVDRPAGPKAQVVEELPDGNKAFLAAAKVAVDLPAVGYEQHEYVVSGTAASYSSDGPLPADGTFALTPGPTADYRTRIVVRQPSDPAKASGTVVVEWLNVSGGFDADPDWSFAGPDLVRHGDTWVGVSVQRIGIEGGPVVVSVGVAADLAGKGLKKLNPERYGSLSHPGDAFSFDMFTQIGRALREGDALGGHTPERVIALGESQSGFALTTYVNGVQPLTHAFDGFFIHSRGGTTMPLGAPGAAISIADAMAGTPTRIRTDQDVPVFILETESDLVSLLDYYPARQDDTEHLRLWEIAGTAHADATLLGPIADTVDCGVAVNDGPQRFAVRAALRHLDTWVRTGTPPPTAERLEVSTTGDTEAIVRDADGIAKGGVRLPPVTVPVAVLSANPGPSQSVICLLLGSTVPLSADQLAARYPSRQAYLDAYAKATDEAIAAGFLLADDRADVLAAAKPDAVAG